MQPPPQYELPYFDDEGDGIPSLPHFEDDEGDQYTQAELQELEDDPDADENEGDDEPELSPAKSEVSWRGIGHSQASEGQEGRCGLVHVSRTDYF